MTNQLTRERKPYTIPTTRLIHAQPAASRHQARHRAAADMEPTTRGIEVSLLTEFACMSRILRHSTHSKQLGEIHALLENALQGIRALILEGAIRPWRSLRLSNDEQEAEPYPDPIRVGIYPMTGNPIHWGDLLSGLTVMARARLDKVIYVISDDGENGESLLPLEIRHAAAKDVLSVFDPLLVYSGIARGGCFDPIKDISLLHALNMNHKLDVYYIVCSGRRLAGQEVSSHRIREALCGARDPDTLAALPYSVFRHVTGGGAYQATTRENTYGKCLMENDLIEKGVI